MSFAYVKFDERGLAELLESRDGPLGEALLKVGNKTVRFAKKNMSPGGSGKAHRPSAPGQAPAVDTGILRSSITSEVGKDWKGLVVRVGTNVQYAKYLELGTARMAARPFLRPALMAQKGVRA